MTYSTILIWPVAGIYAYAFLHDTKSGTDLAYSSLLPHSLLHAGNKQLCVWLASANCFVHGPTPSPPVTGNKKLHTTITTARQKMKEEVTTTTHTSPTTTTLLARPRQLSGAGVATTAKGAGADSTEGLG